MIKKIFWTIIIVLLATGAQYGSAGSIFGNPSIFNPDYWVVDGNIEWQNIWKFIVWLVFVWLPAWFAWKGTKIIPFITIFPIRVAMIIISVIFLPIILIFFALWGIWVKS